MKQLPGHMRHQPHNQGVRAAAVFSTCAVIFTQNKYGYEVAGALGYCIVPSRRNDRALSRNLLVPDFSLDKFIISVRFSHFESFSGIMSEDKDNKEAADAFPSEKTELNNVQIDGDVEKGDHELDDSKVKFINGGSTPNGGDVDVNVGKNDQEFAGIGKEELLKYAKDPFWVKVRLGLFITFWLAWFGMLAAAIVIIVLAPKCPPKPDLDWWQTSVAYQIYPRSFLDTDGNGIGDIKGIESKLDYFGKLGVNTLIIGPIYPTENVDFGYDVTDHVAINPEMGTMADFESLLKKAHKKRVKIVLDFIPNHTSNKHKWFIESSQGNSTNNKYRDYYVWADGKGTGSPPNNWRSKYSKNSSWTKHPKRKQYYYHTFFEEMPELNLRNADVRKELEDIMAFWLNKGVDGFRIGHVSNLFEAADLADEPDAQPNKQPYYELKHTKTLNQPESYNITESFRKFMDQWYSKDGLDQTRVLLVEAVGDINETNAYMGGEDKSGANLVFNTELLSVDNKCNSRCIAEKVKSSLSALAEGKWANWVTGNHDSISRVASRVGVSFVNAMNTLTMTLPGTAIAYYGDEIGMNSLNLTFDETKDKWGKNFGVDYRLVSRDPSRSPMQWTSKAGAGFTNATSWLPLTSTFSDFNVMTEEAVGSTHKFPKVFAKLTKLRKEPSMLWGQFIDAELNNNIFAYVRKAEGHPSFLVAINFGTKPSSDDYTRAVKNLVPDETEIVFNSYNFEHDELAVGKKVKMNNILLKPGEAVVFKYPWQK